MREGACFQAQISEFVCETMEFLFDSISLNGDAGGSEILE